MKALPEMANSYLRSFAQYRDRVQRSLFAGLLGLSLLLFVAGRAAGTQVGPDPEQQTAEVSFEKDVAPILQQRCLSCHNQKDAKGGFSLSTKEALFESGQVEPGDAAASNLVEQISAIDGHPPQMPKDSDPLTDRQQELIVRWIDQGAHWPDDFLLKPAVIKDFDWWSLKPLVRPAIPVLPDVANPVDAFVQARLNEKGLSQNAKANPKDLLRRLCYDLTGLPPTLQDLEDFTQDPSAENYQKFVEAYLASPRYGERWGRHWLDLVRYADTCGYDKDKLRPNAWPYRDYVIRSFNADKVYHRFVKEQLAGDFLYPDTVDGIVGLGFVAAGPWDFIGHVEVPESKLDGKEARNLDRDEMVSATFNVFCSTTVQCARCHNHKFDPITQQHYYNLQSIFAAVDRADRSYEPDPAIARQRVKLQTEIQSLQQQLVKLHEDQMGRLEKELAEPIRQVNELSKALKPIDLQPQYGYHSQIANSVYDEKWIQLDWKQPQRISRVVIYPCYDDFAGIGAGFGFPLSWRLEDEAQRVLHQAETLQRQQALPISIVLDPANPVQALRLTATRLAMRQNDFHLAISEIQVFNAAGQQISAQAELSAKDSIEAPVRWQLQNLVDGIYPTFAVDKSQHLAEIISQVQRQESSLLDVESLAKRRELESKVSDRETALKQLPQQQWVYAAATDFSPNGNFKPTGGKPRQVHVLSRGNISDPTELAVPGTIPLSANDLDAVLQAKSSDQANSEAEYRAALADWIVAPENPLTWRSIVNRIWLHHFDQGLVSTPNDFGRMGQLPTHPDLLDWLAVEFRDNGQSIKQLHRLIVNSQTYQQSSQHNAKAASLDQDNQYYWRANRRKLSAEELRDSILSVSGRLDDTMGGPGYYLFELDKPEHSPHYQYHLFDPADPTTHRRSIYRFVVRSQPDPLMSTFDCADSSQSVPQRDQTLTALQALSLLNNKFTLVMAEQFAKRLQSERSSLPEQIQFGFQLVTGRNPSAEEHAAFVEYGEQHGLLNVCRVLFNLNEFVFVE